jgi:SAM-dependent methyltransferase
LGDGKALTPGLRTLKHWNQWLTQQFLGSGLLAAEHKMLTRLLCHHFGKYALLIGVPHQVDLLSTSQLPSRFLVSPMAHHARISGLIESDFHELPIMTGSIDLVLLPHTLEFIDNPRQLLAEACRIVKPEGLIAICGFNPYGMWSMKKILKKNKEVPWSSRRIPANKIKNWLHLADFQLEKQKCFLFRPPINQKTIYGKLHFLEQFGKYCYPSFGSVYIVLARAKVAPLTPIRLKWKQELSTVSIPTSISGHIAW